MSWCTLHRIAPSSLIRATHSLFGAPPCASLHHPPFLLFFGMGILRPATPGFLVTLAATICLALVVFSVPWLKTIYFLKANLNYSGVQGSIILGCVGYCMDVGEGYVCSQPAIGYQLGKCYSCRLPFSARD